MPGFDYTFDARPTARFRSTLEVRWYRFLKPLTTCLSYEWYKIYPSTAGWRWNSLVRAPFYLSDFFLKLAHDPTYHVAEVKPISALEQFEDYLPKPQRPSHRLYLLGVGSQDGKGFKDGAPGPIWRWENETGIWIPWKLV